MWAEIGDARRFPSSDQLVRFAGLDVTVYSSDGKRSPGHLSRQGSPELRWAAFEAAKCAARRGSPDYGYYRKLAAKHDGHNGKNPTLAVERKILRRCYHTLRELGDAALALPVPEPRRWPPNHALRACPAHTSADARGRLPQVLLSPPRCWVDFPERMSGRTPSAARTPGTPSIIMSPDPRPWTQISSLVPFGDAAHAGKSGAVARRGRPSLAQRARR